MIAERKGFIRNRLKRFTAVLLVAAMVLNVGPMNVIVNAIMEGVQALAANDDVDYLFFATDRHADTNIIATMINNMESDIGENKLEYLGLGGDMVGSGNEHPSYNSSTVLAEVTGATTSLSATNVDIVAGIHDMNVNDDDGIVLPYSGGGAQIFEGDKYYVYGVPESCISGAVSSVDPATEANDFVTWANGSDIDKSKVIIVLSHYPLHQRRNDNDGAVYWATALNKVAVGDDTTIDRDVIFFWGHNHTSETSADTSVYHVAPKGSISVQGGSSNQTIYFTYANAGYLNAKSSATLLEITDTMITFNKYTNSSYSTTGTVTRVTPTVSSIAVSGTTEYTVGDELDLTVTATYSDGTTADVTDNAVLSDYDMSTAGTYTVTATYGEMTATVDITVKAAVILSSIAITTQPTKVEYTVGDTLDTTGMVVTATYSDGSTDEISEEEYTVSDVEMSTSGTKTVTVTYEGLTATFDITVNEAELTVNTVNCWDNSEQVIVKATGLGLTAVAATNVTGENKECDDVFTDNGYMAFDIELTGHTDGNEVAYSISVVSDLDTTNLELYYIDANGDLIPVEFDLATDELNNVYVEFTTTYVGTFVYGSPVVPEGYVLTTLTLEGIPTDLFVGGSLDLIDAVITATYTMEGAEDFVRMLTSYDYDETNFSGYDVNTAGAQTAVFTFEDMTATLDIHVWGDSVDSEDGTVIVALDTEGEEYGVTGVNVGESENTNVATAVQYVITGDNYVAYDITLEYADGYSATEDTKTVTLPIPEGVTNPVVYYVPETGDAVNMNATVSEDGTTVSFTTTHFSTYVLGDGTTIEPESGNATTEGTPESSTTKLVATETTVYKLVTTPVSGQQYLIVNSATGTGYGLDGDTTGYATTAFTGGEGYYTAWDEDAQTGTAFSAGSDVYLTTSGAYLWTAGSNSFSIGYSSSSSFSFGSTSYTYTLDPDNSTTGTWSLSSNKLSISLVTTDSWFGSDTNTTYYLTNGGSTWSMSTSGSNVYFYEPVTIYTVSEETVTTPATPGYTYSVEGTDITDAIAISGQTVTLSSVLYATPDGGETTDITESSGLTPVYEVVTTKGNPNVITSIADGVATLSGTAGTAVVKVTYTSGDLVAWDEFIVTATAIPDDQYTITMHKQTTDADGNPAAGDEITATITIKNIMNGMQDSVWAVVKANGIDLGALGDALSWKMTGDSIGSIDPVTGVITFNGTEGEATVTAYYSCPGGRVIEASVTYSVTLGDYTVPEDGTDDFPEYPDPGAIRFDKHATAVGNFSETGVVQVELSMTGVPYGTDTAIDVVVMLDMTGSMSTNGMNAAVAAAKAFVTKIVQNNDGTYNKNRVAVYQFNSEGVSTYFDLQMISSDSELETALNKIVADQARGGTPFDTAAAHCQTVLSNAKTNLPTGETTYTRKQFCVFMSDGGPTTYEGSDGYTYYGGNATGDRKITEYIGGYTSSTASSWTYNLPTEKYTDAMKADGVTVYTVGLLLQNVPSNPSPYSSMTTSTYDSTTDSLTTIGSHYYFCSTILKNMASDTNKYIDIFSVDNASKATAAFENIAQSILDAATDVKVTDKISSDYTMVFEAPNAVVGEALPEGQEMYIEVKDYVLTPVYDSAGTTIVDYIRGSAVSLMKLYLGKNGSTYYAASDASGTAYATPTFNQTAIGTTYYWTTTQTASGVSVTVDGTTYYFDEAGISSKDEDYVAANWFNMASGAYAFGNITTTDIVDTDSSGETTQNSVCNDLIIATPYFVYNASTKMLTWTAAKLSTSELALSYFLYLNESGGYSGADDETEAGTYETNEYAYLNYTNFQGTECQQTFPVPQMTWNGAQVSYVFYLVNDEGQPVNRAGKVVPFSEAVYVTDVFTYSIVWNDLEQVASLEAGYLAEELVPSVYSLYDGGASYNIHVFEDEVGQNLNNHFVIGSDSSTYTTYVFNTKADATKYKNPGTYAATSTYKCKEYVEGGQYTDDKGAYNIVAKTGATVVETGFDFSNTTVAFAVVWKPQLVEDTVVVDFGLDVVIDVIKNDNMAAGVVGVRDTAPSGVTTEGTYDRVDADTQTFVDLYIDANNDEGNLKELKIGTASVENLTSVRFSLDQTNGMQFTDPVEFYYEADVNYYVDTELKTASMYSKVTVIPATTVYYEDSFLTYTGDWSATAQQTSTATQDQDRPGESQISASLDADNVYGYDSAYTSMSTYSAGSAMKATVSAGNSAQASFTFFGTGFDVISLTDSTTGTIMVDVYAYNEDGSLSDTKTKSFIVDTYYGYTYNEETQEWTVSQTASDTLYQIPVMKISGLTYGKYKAEITAVYVSLFDHQKIGSYDFYLDAIRIYDPTGNENAVANDAYVKDGEGYPLYLEVRDEIISAGSFGEDITVTTSVDGESVSATTEVGGIVFIDGNGKNKSISDYINYGPNNELYLAPGQSIAFEINNVFENGSEIEVEPVDVQIAVKSVGGSASVEMFNPGIKVTTETTDNTTTTTTTATQENLLTVDLNTATDMYYSIKSLSDGTIVISNVGESGIVSITNLKFTFTEAAKVRTVQTTNGDEIEDDVLKTSRLGAVYSLRSLSAYSVSETVESEVEATEAETSVPEFEETEPETTEPVIEETEAETAEPETEETEAEIAESETEETEAETAEPETEETEPETTETEAEETESEGIVETIGGAIRKIIGIIGGWFGKWFN